MTQDHNPYAPPAPQAAVPVGLAPTLDAGPGGLSLSDRGWDLVSQMAKWMRIVSVFMFIFAGILVLTALFLGLGSGLGNIPNQPIPMGYFAVGILLYSIVSLLSGIWIRGAAGHFYEGVMSDSPAPLALGFRRLRLYLILYGLVGILGLGFTFMQLVIPKLG
ncbi:MAG: hypothetical protein JRH20_26135 [Deltaproteobacteria bacterium]|nr:hypothetical protein [Deltaproteobacteria bacterium]